MGNNTSPKALQSILIIVVICFIVGILPTVSAFDWTDGIVSYYKLDENAANTDVDDAHGSNDGTASTNTANLYDASGKINSTFDFDGSSEYFTVVTSSLDNQDTISCSGWVYIDSAGNGNRRGIIESYGTNIWAGISIEVGTDNKIKTYIPNPTHALSDILIDSGTSPTDQWVHIVVVRTDGDNQLWINGVEEDTGTTTSTMSSSNFTCFRVGTYRGANDRFFDGKIDEVGIWSRALTSTEISELYSSTNGLPYGILSGSGITASLSFPPEGVLLSDIGYNFIANYTNSSYNLTNSTYYIWKKDGAVYNIFNTTTTTNFTNNSTTQFIDSFTLGKYKWNVLVCGDNETGTLCAWAPANYTFEIGASIDYEEYSNSTYATTSETFDINISLLSGVILYEATLNYNGTEYLGTITDLGSELYSITRTIDIPSVDSETDIVFYWTFNYDDGGTTSQNSTSHNQIILNIPTIIITDGACGAGFFSSVF